MFCETTDHQRLFYQVQGNPDSSETIVFLNGLTQSTMAWGLTTPHFKNKYKLILLDFIFQGQSDKSGEWRDFDTHANDVRMVLEKEKIHKATFVGISYGSLVAQHFAVRFSQYLKNLILLSTFAHKTPYYEAIELSWWRALEMGGYGLMLDIMLPTVLSEGYFANPLVSIANLKKVRQDLNLDPEAIFKLMLATKERKDFRKNLKMISCPTLIIQGEKDILFPVHLAEEVRANIKNAKLMVIKNAGHTLNLEHVDEVCKQIELFLSQVK
jgi:3-oxoadipate enol-lactonase